MNKIPIKLFDSEEHPAVYPIKKGTAYKWHSKGKFPNLIYKVAGVLIFDLDEYDKMSKMAQKSNIKRGNRIFSPLTKG